MDKILTAPVGAIQKFSTEDGPGIRTTVFLKGCPLDCLWCHNPELIENDVELIQSPTVCIGCGECIRICPQGAISSGEDGIVIDREKCVKCMKCTEACTSKGLRSVAVERSVDEVMHDVVQDKGFYDHTGGGMTISGGEMLIHPEFVKALVDDAAEKGINVCIDTSGFGNGDFLEAMAARDNVTTVLYDIKAVEREKHKKLTGEPNDLILKNLRRLSENSLSKNKIMIRMPLIAGLNDQDEDISDTVKLLTDLGLFKVTLLPYHSLGVNKKKRIGGHQDTFETPSDEHVEEIKAYFEAAGFEVEIQGKV